MSLNNAHTNGGLLVFTGERILVFYDGVKMSFDNYTNGAFNGTKSGKAFLTTHRVVFISKGGNDDLQSFSMPFYTMKQVEVEQPIFGANYIKGHVVHEQNGGWEGRMKWKMWFNKGGAIEFAKVMLRLAGMAKQRAPPIGFEMPSAPFYEAPPPAYSHPMNDQYSFTQNNQYFDAPPSNIYSYGVPPPYSGVPIDNCMMPQPTGPEPTYPPPGYAQQPAPGYPQQPAPGYPQQPAPGYPQQPPPGQQSYQPSCPPPDYSNAHTKKE